MFDWDNSKNNDGRKLLGEQYITLVVPQGSVIGPSLSPNELISKIRRFADFLLKAFPMSG